MRLTRRAALALATLVGLAAPALATKYEVTVDVDDEEDLYELAATGQIGEETLEALVELLQRGVDLNTATREELYALPNLTYAEVDAIIAFRELSGRIDDPAELVHSGVLDAGRLAAIAAFLVVRPAGGAFSTDGQLRLQTRWSVEDEGAPATALQTRVATLQHLTVGLAAVVTRNRLGEVRYDPVRDALAAEPAATRVALPKLFAAWETASWRAIAGSYRVGFGQRLTFDNTRLYTPNGFVVDDQLFRGFELVAACHEADGELGEVPCEDADRRVTPDYRWQDGLMGAAATASHVPLGPGHLQATGFASYQTRDLYQYEIYDRAACDDPRSDDPACSAPTVYQRQDDPLAPTSRYIYTTLPDVFAETTVGGNLGFALTGRDRVGVTAYTSATEFLTEGIDLDFQEWSRFPRGGRYGAVGVDGAVGIGSVDVFAEVTRSFDAVPDGGGGMGGIVRAVVSPTRNDEVEASVRYYGEDFANPSARAIAAPDEVDGFRARDELGARLRYTGTFERRLTVRGSADLWRTPSNERLNLTTYLRGDVDVTDQWRRGMWLSHQDKDVGTGGRGQCFEFATDTDEDGETVPCSGQRLRGAGRLRFSPTRRSWVSLQYEHTLVDDRLGDRFRQDSTIVVAASAAPTRDLGVRARVRYADLDLSDDDPADGTLSSYLEARYRMRRRDWLRLRVEDNAYVHLYGPFAKVAGSNELSLWLSYESRF